MRARIDHTFAARLITALVLTVAASACGGSPHDAGSPLAVKAEAAPLSGRVTLDGSSTVYPVSMAMAKAFRAQYGDVQVVVNESGTGGGFKKFCAGETDINGASRPINLAESELCRANHVEFIELPIALDSLSVVVSRANTFVQCL